VKPNGQLEQLADEGVDVLGVPAWDAEPKPVSNADLTELAIKGKYRGRAKTVTWRWDESEGRYISTVTPKDQAAGM
jgi:hypothetical protein